VAHAAIVPFLHGGAGPRRFPTRAIGYTVPHRPRRACLERRARFEPAYSRPHQVDGEDDRRLQISRQVFPPTYRPGRLTTSISSPETSSRKSRSLSVTSAPLRRIALTTHPGDSMNTRT
jgi:hypothetical protein